MSSSGNRKDMTQLITQARAEGAVVDIVPSGHIRVSFNNRSVNLPNSPRDPRSIYNARTRMRRIGLCL